MNDVQVIEEGAVTAREPARQVVAVGVDMLLQVAVERGADLAQLERLLELKQRVDAEKARQAYNDAISAFRAEDIRVAKNRHVTDGPLKGKRYAELHMVVNATREALSRHGLSTSWRLTRDEKDWIEVTCTLRHSMGHAEHVSMGGPPDVGGAKNAIQARASTVTYLERYTLKAILGIAEDGDDVDGAAPRGVVFDLGAWVEKVVAAANRDELNAIYKEATSTARKAGDSIRHASFKAVWESRAREMDAATSAKGAGK